MRTIILIAVLLAGSVLAVTPENAIIVVIDGMRDDDGFGAGPANLPRIWNDLKPQGTYYSRFWDRGWTATTGGHTTILSGVYQIIRNNGSNEADVRSFDPLMPEYFRSQFGAPESSCGVVIGKWGNVGAIADFGLEPAYGEPVKGFVLGSDLTHDDTLSVALLHRSMDSLHPRLVLINMGDVDAKGHLGVYADYLQSIRVADSLVAGIWNHIQAVPPYSDTFFRNRTALIVTSDHGRHDDAHGSFPGHGNWDHGSRHVGFLALGPGIAANRVITSPREQIDIVPTVGSLLGFATPFAEGSVMTEMLADGLCARTAEPGVPVLDAANLSNTAGFSRDPDIAADRYGNLYCVWSDKTPQTWTVQFRKSTDAGASWSAPARLFSFPEQESVAWYARVAADDSLAVSAMSWNRHANYIDSLPGGRWDTTFVWYPHLATSTDQGATWSHASFLDSSMGSYYAPVAVRNGRYSLAWWAVGQFGTEVPGNGLHFAARAASSPWPAFTQALGNQHSHIALTDDGTNLHMASSAWQDQDNDISYAISTNAGATWTRTWVCRDLSPVAAYDYDPELVVDAAGTVHLFWARKENAGGTWQLLYGRRDPGTGLWDTTRLTNSSKGAWQPHAAIKGDTIMLVWLDYADGNPEVYCRFSPDLGLSWSPPERVTYTPALTHHPRVAATSRGFYCVWQDLSSGNWEIYGRELSTYAARDAGVSAILAPVGTRDTIVTVVPKATVGNFGPMTATFRAFCTIRDVGGVTRYFDSTNVIDLGPGVSADISFPAWARPYAPGVYTVACSTWYAGDQNLTNNSLGSTFTLVLPVTGWVERAPVPELPSGKEVKYGGWLIAARDQGVKGSRDQVPGPSNPRTLEPWNPVLFAAKGNKTQDFYRYSVEADSWYELETIPADEEGRNRLPYRGSAGTTDGLNSIYMTKGNNTFGFWRYDIGSDYWSRLPGVPEGPFGKKVKGGTGLAYVLEDDTGWVYLLKGYRTEFYRYNTLAGRWDTLDPAPDLSGKAKYDKGSFLVFDGEHTLFAAQAKYHNDTNHYLFRYCTEGDTWFSRRYHGMPVLGLHNGGLKAKKLGDGGSGAWWDGAIYALKGNNTQQFFRYNAAQDSWRELDTMPTYSPTSGRRKRVKYGAGIAGCGNGLFFALKGNKTREFWRYIQPAGAYGLPLTANRSGVMANPSTTYDVRLTISPNPLASGRATISFSLPKAGPVTINVFDVAGRSVFSAWSLGHWVTGSLRLDLRSLSAGVYLLRLESPDGVATQRLVVQK